MTSPGTPLPMRRPVWSLTQPCKRGVSATSFLRGNRGTEELRYLPEIPQQGRGPWGSRRLHSGTRLPSTPPTPRHLPLLSSRGQRRLPPAVGAAEPPFGMLHFGRTEKPRRPPVPSGLEVFRLRLSRRALPCPSASPATAVARTKHQRHENGPNGPESEARSPRSLPQGTQRGARAASPRAAWLPDALVTYRPLSGRLPCVEIKKETLNRAWSREGPRRKPPHPSTVLVHQEQDDDPDRSNS